MIISQCCNTQSIYVIRLLSIVIVMVTLLIARKFCERHKMLYRMLIALSAVLYLYSSYMMITISRKPQDILQNDSKANTNVQIIKPDAALTIDKTANHAHEDNIKSNVEANSSSAKAMEINAINSAANTNKINDKDTKSDDATKNQIEQIAASTTDKGAVQSTIASSTTPVSPASNIAIYAISDDHEHVEIPKSDVTMSAQTIDEYLTEYSFIYNKEIEKSKPKGEKYSYVTFQISLPSDVDFKQLDTYIYDKKLSNIQLYRWYEHGTWYGVNHDYKGTYVSGDFLRIQYNNGYISGNLALSPGQEVKAYVLNAPNKMNLLKKYDTNNSHYSFTGITNIFIPKYLGMISFIISGLVLLYEMILLSVNNLFVSIVILAFIIKSIFIHWLYRSHIKSQYYANVIQTLSITPSASTAVSAHDANSNASNPVSNATDPHNNPEMVQAMSASMRAKLLPMILRLLSFGIVNKILSKSFYVQQMPLLWIPAGAVKDPYTLYNIISMATKCSVKLSILNPSLIAIMTVMLIAIEQKVSPQMQQGPGHAQQQYIVLFILTIVFSYFFPPIICACIAAHCIVEIIYCTIFSLMQRRR